MTAQRGRESEGGCDSRRLHGRRRYNPPKMPFIDYSLDTRSGFMSSMLDKLRLAGSDFCDPASSPLRKLNARSAGDPSIAILDAWATVADVLAFYQERIANEGFLRTATERRSILELASLIGYELAPGAAAGTYLAFTVEDAPGSPDAVDIPAFTRVQSIPDPGKLPQIFETSQEKQARSGWNSLRPRVMGRQAVGDGSTRVLLKGIGTRLKPGDALLFVGPVREADPRSDAWQVRTLTGAYSSVERNVTLVTWDEPLGRLGDPEDEAFCNPSVFALRSRASLFGSGVPDWRLIPFELRDTYVKAVYGPGERWDRYEWPGLEVKQIDGSWVIDLDAVYTGICRDSWFLLIAPPPFGSELGGMTGLYRVRNAVVTFRSEFAAAAKISRIFPDTHGNLEDFPLRQTEVFFNSEPLHLAEVPLYRYIGGNTIDLSNRVSGLTPGKILAVSGRALPETEQGETERGPDLRLWVQGGGEASDPGGTQKETASEIAVVRAAEDRGNRTRLILEAPLTHRYDPATLTICANVVLATHGETIRETLGSGDKTLANQRFVIKKPPLTHTRSAVPGGVTGALEVRVNGVLWSAVPSLHALNKSSRSYIVRIDDDGRPSIIFGDGKSGARLPTGEGNVKATYRSGIGHDGNVPAGRLTLLQSRPPGIRAVTNPIRASGGEPPEILSLARHNAPMTVQTLGRVVSLRDYENFSCSFPGVGKAYAASVSSGHRPVVHITVAASDGSVVDESSELIKKLLEAISAVRSPIEGVLINSFTLKTFSVTARVQADEGYLFREVEMNIISALGARFSFERRSFGESICKSEVIAEMQSIEGVEAVILDRFGYDPLEGPPGDAGRSISQIKSYQTVLQSRLTRVERGRIFPAELILLNPSEGGIKLRDMSV